MASNKLSKLWWEDPVSFLIQYWWIILLSLLIFFVFYFTRCYWYPDFCPTRLSIVNSTPYELRVALSGSQNTTITIPKCLTCQVYSQPGLSECPTTGSIVVENIEAGVYGLVVYSPDDPTKPSPYYGELTLFPHQTTSECFYVIETGFSSVDVTGEFHELIPTVTEPTEKPVIIKPTLTFFPVNWLDYQNDSIGISLKYPNTWYGEENNDLVSFNTDNNNNVEISRRTIPNGMTQEEYINSLYPDTDFKVEPRVEKQINGVKWLVIIAKYNELNWEIVTYSTFIDNNIVVIKYFRPTTSESEDQLTDQANFNQLMNNIRISE